ncbi:MAG: SDR family NAD(P)-dependent oxidoreductase [Paracoccaceae bacterium]
MAISVHGKSVIVTGASKGVGLAVARKFAEDGARVMLASSDEEALEAAVSAMGGAGPDLQYFAGDFREKLTIANLLAATIDAFDRVDVLANARRESLTSDPLNPDQDVFQHLMDQNVTANLRICQAVSRRMIQQAGEIGENGENECAGSIVNVTSIAARRTLPELLSYSVSMAALDQLTRSLAVALAAHRIRVNGVALGSVMGASLREALRDQDGLHEEMTAVTPMGRIGEAGEAAEAILFLASDAASFITGQILTVDGGRTLLDPLCRPAAR